MYRSADIKRETAETYIDLQLSLEGGDVQIGTGIGFFDHMLNAFAFYSGFGLTLSASGDLDVDGHHTVEDTGIALGMAIREALGDKIGIRRYGTSFIPMDDALCLTSLDCSGRGFLVYDAIMPQPMIGDYDACLTEEFMRALAHNAGITLHQKVFHGKNSHHITEALFKSLGIALRNAVLLDDTDVPSTKGVL